MIERLAYRFLIQNGWQYVDSLETMLMCVRKGYRGQILSSVPLSTPSMPSAKFMVGGWTTHFPELYDPTHVVCDMYVIAEISLPKD